MLEPTVRYDGKYLQVATRGSWEYVTRKNLSGIVCILAITDDGKLLLVEQYRPPLGKRVVELPAGLAGDGVGQEDEELATAARRELLEETGYEARSMERLAAGTPSAGLSDELITFFHAKDLTKTGLGEGDGQEQITVHEVPLEQVESWLDARAAENLLVDLKVYCGLYFAKR